MNIASFIEHSLLTPTARLADVELVCKDAVQFGFTSVCVPPMFVKKTKALTAGSTVKVATVIGFPLGYSVIEAKLAETVLAIVDGADELNVMLNMLALKNGDWQYLAKEINTLLPVIRKSEKIIKVIIEAGLLSKEEIVTCCDIYGAAAVDFIQISSGFDEKLPTLETLKLIRMHLADAIQIKAGDGDAGTTLTEWISAGASRIACKDPVKAIKDLEKNIIFK